jgi:hypothetical protein
MTIAIAVAVVAVLAVGGLARFLHSNPPDQLIDEEQEARLRQALARIDDVYPDPAIPLPKDDDRTRRPDGGDPHTGLRRPA